MSEEKKKRKKKKDVVEEYTDVVSEETQDVVVEEEPKETVTEKAKEKFTTSEKLYIIKLISDGYRPFDIVKKARFTLNLSEEKMKRLSLNIRTAEQLVNALED